MVKSLDDAAKHGRTRHETKRVSRKPPRERKTHRGNSVVARGFSLGFFKVDFFKGVVMKKKTDDITDLFGFVDV